MKKTITILILALSVRVFAQAPTIEWQKCLGGSGFDEAYSIQQTSDRGYIIAGVTNSNDGDVSGNHGGGDYWLVKLDTIGNIQWQKCLGGANSEGAFSVQQTYGNGYIVAGYSWSIDGDVNGNHSTNYDYWVVKLDSVGNIQWQKCLGGQSSEWAASIRQTLDNGYIVAGFASSIDGDVTNISGSDDYWVVKLDSNGNIQWQKCLGGLSNDRAYSIQQTQDRGYVVTGFSPSNDGIVIGNHGGQDFWVVKLDTVGNLEWQKCLGGTLVDEAYSIQQTTDNGYIVAGKTSSNDGDVSGNHSPLAFDSWVVKLDSLGNLEWQKCLGGTDFEVTNSILQTSFGGYIAAGTTTSNDGDVIGNHGGKDVWVEYLDAQGNLEWQKCLGGTNNEEAFSIQQTLDGGYILAGNTGSNNGDVNGLHGDIDYWIVKLAPLVGIIKTSPDETLSVFPNPASEKLVTKSENSIIAEVNLYNLLGELVWSRQPNAKQTQLDISKEAKGVYFVKVKDVNQKLTFKKVVIQ